MKNALLLVLMAICFFSCKNEKKTPESLDSLKSTVAQIDSVATAMYGWEPQDSTYNRSVDTLVADIMNQYNEDKPDSTPVVPSASAVMQDAYNQARKTWTEFKRLVDSDKYEEALNYYFADSAGGEEKNSGDFIVFLKHSTYRYQFYSEVLLPLMRELKGDTFAVNQYIDILNLEKSIEDASIMMSQQNEPYIPEVYPYVVKDLGFALAASGKMDEALNLTGDLIHAVFDLTGSVLYANFFGTQYCAQLYAAENYYETAIALWEDFEDNLNKNNGNYTHNELSDMKARIDREKQLLYNLQR